MNYESINEQYSNGNTFFKLKYGFENKTKELEKFMWENKKAKIKKNKTYQTGKIPNFLKVDIKPLIKTSITNSFGIEVKIKLTSPYYSSDDDDFYIINNPCLKESVFKLPMVRGSGWKGSLLKAGIEIFKDEKNHQYLGSIFRIFGVGNSEYRELFEKNNKVIKNKIMLFLAMEMGVNFEEDIATQLQKYFKIKAIKGRAIFYPTYFEKLSLELINPHNRKTKAGTNPIHYEVVPKESKAELKIVYIPFDGINQENDDIKKEAKQDLEFLAKCIKKVSQNGIGAKTKLGWGRFEMDGKIDPFWSER
jgi:CRISPR-associated protein Cmr2